MLPVSIPHTDGRVEAVPILPRYSQTRRLWQHAVDSSYSLLTHATEYIFKHLIGYINTSWSDAITELHCSVDFIDQQSTLWVFQHIDSQNASTYGLGRTYTQVSKLRSDRAIAGNSTSSCICDPVFTCAIDCADGAITDDKCANISLWFCNMLLDIMDMMLGGAKCLLVFEYCLSRITVINSC